MHVPKLYLTEPYSWKIRDIDIRPTYRCNARCPTCGSWKRKSPDLSVEQAMVICDHFHKLRKVIIEGGEPLLWGPLSTFIKHLDAEEIVVITNAIFTEGVKHITKSLTPQDFRFVVSLNGIGKIHDFSRGVKGAFTALVKSVDIMVDRGYNVRFQYVGLKENVGNLEETRHL